MPRAEQGAGGEAQQSSLGERQSATRPGAHPQTSGPLGQSSWGSPSQAGLWGASQSACSERSQAHTRRDGVSEWVNEDRRETQEEDSS